MKYYCIGIKGSGMSTLAQILYDLGNSVTGYDDVVDYKFTQDGLDKRGIKIYFDHEHEIDKDTIVTYSKAFSLDHPELKRVRALGLQIKSYNDILGDLSREFETVGVCGTHGKTTTSSLISHILKQTKGCNYFIGDGSGFADLKNKLFVLESCEYQKHFLAYNPTYTVVTNIELEHVECYNGLDDIIKTFEKFANKSKLVVACGDDKNIRKMNIKVETTYYGFNDDNDVVAKNVVLNKDGASFDVYMNNSFYGHFDIPLYGEHMVLDALASIIICNRENVDKSIIHDCLHTFVNAKRRFKEKTFGNIVIVDDYAHHPTELKVTLEAAKQKYPDKTLIGVFLPNTYSRTEALMDDFASSLAIADKAYVMDIHCDREKMEDYPNASSDILISKIPRSEKISIDSISKLLEYDNAVVCFMSCTNIYEIENKYEELLQK